MTVYLADTLDGSTIATAESKTGTASAASDYIAASGNTMANGDRVVFTSLTGGAGLSTGVIYWVVGKSTSDFQVSTTQGGAAVNITSDYSALTVARWTAPTSWTEETTVGGAQNVPYWTVVTAPLSGMIGKVAAGVQTGSDKYMVRAFDSAAGNGSATFIRFATTASTSTRGMHVYFYNGTTLAFSILCHSDGKMYVTNMATAATQIAASWAASTVYEVIIKLGASGAISSITVNGSTTSSPGTMNNSVTAIDRVRVNAYNGGSGSGTMYFDLICSDTSTAVPNGSLVTTGTQDGISLGALIYGNAGVGFADGSSVAATIERVRRSADGGSTYADVTSSMLTVAGASGFTIRDRRPRYGSQPVASGSNAKYEVLALNGNGEQTLTTGSLALARDLATIKSTRATLLHNIMAGTYIAADSTHGLSGEKYPANAVMAMAYAYYALGNSTYKTDAETQFNYITSTIANSDFLHVLPDDNTVVYRDFHMREIYMCAVAARLLTLAGASATAASWMTEIDKWAKAFFDKLNSGNPAPTTLTNYGWDPNNTRTGTQNAVWQANHAYAVGDIVKPTTNNSRTYRCTTAGTSHATTEPTWTTTGGATQSDGTVTWTCIYATGKVTYSTYTNNGTTYPAVASTDVMDVNQLSEEAAAWALLTTDPNSAFYSAGTYKTKAETRITDIMALLQTYQVTRGAVPIGESLSGIPYNGNQQYDTVYGGFTVTTAAVVYSQRPDLCHAATVTWLDRTLDWLDTSYNATEPLATQHYDDTTYIGLPEVEFAQAGYQVRGRTNPRANLWNEACFIDVSNDKWRWYAQDGAVTNSPTIGDPVQVRLLNGLAISESVLNWAVQTGQATETDTGLGMSVGLGANLGVGTETDDGLWVRSSTGGAPQSVTIGVGTETDSAFDATPTGPAPQSVTIGVGAETDSALDVAVAGQIRMNMRMPPETVIGAYLRHEWIGSEVPVRGAGSYPGVAVQEAAVDDYGEVLFQLGPGSYIAWAEDYPLRRRFFVITDD